MSRLRILALSSLALMLNACSHTRAANVQRPAGDTVKFALTDSGCSPAHLQLTAGPHTFVVTNSGSSAVTEFEVLDKERIIGEAENLTPGLHGSFSLNIHAGSYRTHCPGGSGPDGTLSVTGRNTSELTPAATAAVKRYRTYLLAQTNLLAQRSERFVAAINRGDRNAAKALYASTHEPYERIEPVAEQFPELDRRLDARSNEATPATWSGFHRIESILWQNRPMTEAQPYARKLHGNIAQLHRRIVSMSMDPAQIADGAVGLLDEVAKTKVTGEEERYSHTDLLDFQANVDGARAAYRALAPLLHKQDPQLAATIALRFSALETRLHKFARNNGYVPYNKLGQDDIRALSSAVNALAEPLSKVAPRVVATRG